MKRVSKVAASPIQNTNATNTTLRLWDGTQIDTAQLTDDEYKTALRIGIQAMIELGHVKPGMIWSKERQAWFPYIPQIV